MYMKLHTLFCKVRVKGEQQWQAEVYGMHKIEHSDKNDDVHNNL